MWFRPWANISATGREVTIVANVIVWPHAVLIPAEIRPNIVPFTRSGGRSIGGIEPVTRTDRGFWSIDMERVALHDRATRQTWEAISEMLGGRAGIIAVPVWSFATAPYVDGIRLEPLSLPHSDGSRFSDGSGYRQRRIIIKSADAVAIGATSIRLQIINADPNLVGVRFSYEHGLYKTGPVTLISGDYWTVPITPAARTVIPAGADLEFDMPTCLCRLEVDRGMDAGLNANGFTDPSVSFVEATDQWAPA